MIIVNIKQTLLRCELSQQLLLLADNLIVIKEGVSV